MIKLARYEIEMIQAWAQEHGERANLRSANLVGADLRLADLRLADLCLANLRSADLCLANLRSANLVGADLSSADLSAADLRLADLRLADLRLANLRLANLVGADLSSANLRLANLRLADLSGAKININDHSQIAYVIGKLGTLKTQALKGLVYLHIEWCWDVWLSKTAPQGHDQSEWDYLVISQREAVISELAKWDFNIEVAPEIIAKARREYLKTEETTK